MKKFTIAILALLYIGTSAGVTVHMHYCMGKLADWGLGHTKSKTCSKCGMEKSHGCCKDEYKLVKNDSDQKITEPGFQPVQLTASALAAAFVELPVNVFSSLTEKNSFIHAPPRSSGIAVYIRNCVFLI